MILIMRIFSRLEKYHSMQLSPIWNVKGELKYIISSSLETFVIIAIFAKWSGNLWAIFGQFYWLNITVKKKHRILFLTLDIAAIEFDPHAWVTGLDNNNFNVPGRDRVECVQHWREMITVSSKDLK